MNNAGITTQYGFLFQRKAFILFRDVYISQKEVVLTLLNSPYAITSITKLIFIAFCIKYESNI